MKRPLQNKLAVAPLLIVAILALPAWLADKKPSKNRWLKETPPGTLKVSPNFFCDQTEIPNESWREYVYWTKRVFGANSPEFKATLPDTTVWLEKDPCLADYSEFYFVHPRFDYYPVVGISQKQAVEYSKWRSDRVFERLLISNGKIQYDYRQNRETYFTIEKYFAGKFQHVVPDTDFLYYPSYRLPTMEEYRMLLRRSDSIYKKHPLKIQAGITPCTGKGLNAETTKSDLLSGRTNMSIVRLRGNVSEWVSEDDICMGGGWADKMAIVLSQDTFHLKTQNAWTGFRNVCEWKKYEGK